LALALRPTVDGCREGIDGYPEKTDPFAKRIEHLGPLYFDGCLIPQARREPQRGPGNHYREALLRPPPYHNLILATIETPKASRGKKRGQSCPLTIRLGVWGNVVSCTSGVLGEASAENGFYAYLMSEISHLEHPFQYF